jgi:type IV pilus assembly protein PilB
MTQTVQGDIKRAAAEPAKPVRVGDLLVSRGVITAEQLAKALATQKEQGHKRLVGEVLVEQKLVTPEQLLEALAEGYGVPFVRLSPRMVDPHCLELLPREFLDKHTVAPLFHVGGKLTVAMADPANVFLIEEIQRLANCPVQIVAATAADIRATLQSQLPQANVFVIDDLVGDMKDDALHVVEQQVQDLSNLDDSAAGDSPVIKLVNYIIFSAVQERASDVHIEPGERSLRVRFRVDGNLYEKMKPPFQMSPAIVSRIKIMAGMDISERRVPQDGGITVVVAKRSIDLRVSTMPGKFGEKVVLRVIDNRGSNITLDQLGFGFEMLAKWRSIVQQPNGIVLVTGPTGSGKSTTLYATLKELVDVSVNISTVEDPVEYQLEGINQFQTNDKAGFTFAKALRALLRQDPDIVMVGEIRDQETAKIAVQAALTGHLVVSTLHTNDAPSAITRLYNIGVEPYLVAASVKGVLAQRLIRKVCKDCKEPAELPAPLRSALDKLSASAGVPTVETTYKGRGCRKCRNTGYSGRIGIYELFAPDDELLDAVSRGATLQELRRLALGSGKWVTLAQDGLDKVRAGITSVEELFTAVAAE